MKRSKPTALSQARANKRAEALINVLLKEMQRGMRNRELLESVEWERLFGSKQSVVVNVQKLVQALAALPVEAACDSTRPSTHPEEVRLSDEEMRQLTQWLEDGAEK